ncbi:hypothetical protein IMG5_154150, partial [Ichthyophthirius multifiliis]
PENMRSFNLSICNDQNVSYYSVGAETLQAHCSDLFKVTSNVLYNGLNKSYGPPTDNDGVFCHEEIQWGTHLLNFECDHSDLVGLGRKTNTYEQVINLLMSNIRYNYGISIE